VDAQTGLGHASHRQFAEDRKPMMFLKSRLAAIAVAATLAMGSALAFTDAEKKDIGEVVKQYLLEHPEVIQDALNELKRRQDESEAKAQSLAISENATRIFRSEADLVAGNPAGKVTMVEFFDYNCGYCKRAFPDVIKMIDADKDLRVVMKEFPILGPGSTFAARAALASKKQGKYWEYHSALMAHEGRMDEAAALAVAGQVGLDVGKLKQDMDSPDISAALDANMQLAEALSIQGTPAFIVDKTLIPGAIGFEGLTAAVKDVRDQGGCQVC
jgi:protein-disulfide isomerase